MSEEKRAKGGQRRSREELRIASEWVFYEYWMVKGLCYLWNESGDFVEIALTRNAMIDSLLIHSRALVDFFYRDSVKVHTDDVLAIQYLDDGRKWHEKHNGDPDWFKDLRKRINRQVAHVTYTRVVGQREPWTIGAIFDLEQGIDEVLVEFLGLVPEDLLGKRWNRFREERHLSKPPISSFPDFLIRGGDVRSSFGGDPMVVIDSYLPGEKP